MLADDGWSVAMVERNHLGGTCINTGCTPTKTMVASAQIAHYVRNAAKWGIRTDGMRVDLGAIVQRKDRNVGQWRAGQQRRFEDRAGRIRLYRGHGRFSAPHAVAVKGETLESDRIFIDTGTRVAIPSIGGLDQVPYLTNETIMELREVPRHLLVLGGGYIGLEFGQMFRRFGSEVTVVDQGEQIIAHEDPEVSGALQKILEAEGIRFVQNAALRRAENRSGEIRLALESAGAPLALDGSHLLIATGRRPNTDDLGVDAAGIELDAHGYIKVNDRLETSVPGIWAIGDVKGGPAFTHLSYNDYQIIYGNLAGKRNLSVRDRIVPYAVFTDPELGRVGMTEKEARARGLRLRIGTIPVSSIARAIEREETAGLMKLVIDADSERILGAAMLCSNGGELVQIISAVMMAGAPWTVLRGAVYIHPTMAEGLWTLMEAAARAV
jgi:pyruvate/2-oxoglutarate dehydrogenase complex dihydrolipoamide dehydrogenase (E3) component